MNNTINQLNLVFIEHCTPPLIIIIHTKKSRNRFNKKDTAPYMIKNKAEEMGTVSVILQSYHFSLN